MCDTIEIFKPIDGLGDLYEVSNTGRVRCLGKSNTVGYQSRVRYLKPDTLKFGYQQVSLYKDNKPKKYKVHRLVAAAFVENPENYPLVNHLDCNTSNNHFKNLERTDYKGNAKHAVKMGKMKGLSNEENPISKLTNAQVAEIRKLRTGGEKLGSIAKKYKICFQHVSRICNKKQRNIEEQFEFKKRELVKARDDNYE